MRAHHFFPLGCSIVYATQFLHLFKHLLFNKHTWIGRDLRQIHYNLSPDIYESIQVLHFAPSPSFFFSLSMLYASFLNSQPHEGPVCFSSLVTFSHALSESVNAAICGIAPKTKISFKSSSTRSNYLSVFNMHSV